MNLKIILFFLLSTAFSYSQTNETSIKISCSDLKSKDYYYNDKNTFKNGSIKLFSYQNGKRFDALNKFILKNSEYLLELDPENTDLMFHQPDSVFDNSEDNKKFQNAVDRLNLSKIFTTDSESESYQKLHEESNESENISTRVYCLDKILVYNIELTNNADKGSPYNEFLNIDLNKMKLVDFTSLITDNQLNAFNKAILNYANSRKKEIINNYKQILSNGFGDLLNQYQLAFEQSDYDYDKVKCKIDSKDFNYFSSEGLIFKVRVLDKNLTINEEKDQIGEYISEIIIPYKEIMKYLDTQNSLYSSINKHH
ncbi:hypothetical protein [Flavobacterium pectinovorum]|uniref:Uncharacterized protein n=1 Tax=Flavobacterium pectinovorum TaxID=29533 RepID=A0A502EUG8_9FLAO|nr:hypothetical protein [Flavobacterium pectinovorum]TPG41545.1 hypothetical protein EAH81_08650 [Flavobacterium pectinovorum]